MKCIFKRVFAIVMLAIIMAAVMCQFASAESISGMSNDYFVQDNAGVMVYNEIDKLAENARKFHNEYNVRLMIVTVNSLDGASIENAAIRIAEESGINTEGRDILVLLSIEDNMVHVLIGEEIKGYITVQEVNKIIKNYIFPDFENEQYTLGLTAFQNILINEVRNSVQPNFNENVITLKLSKEEEIAARNIIFLCVILILVLFVEIFFISK